MDVVFHSTHFHATTEFFLSVFFCLFSFVSSSVFQNSMKKKQQKQEKPPKENKLFAERTLEYSQWSVSVFFLLVSRFKLLSPWSVNRFVDVIAVAVCSHGWVVTNFYRRFALVRCDMSNDNTVENTIRTIDSYFRFADILSVNTKLRSLSRKPFRCQSHCVWGSVWNSANLIVILIGRQAATHFSAWRIHVLWKWRCHLT